jgi:ribosomal protein S18 acetylase RimI-like enzyme
MKRAKLLLGIVISLIFVGSFSFYYFYYDKQYLVADSQASIQDFNYEQDNEAVTELLKSNWEVLSPLIPEYDPRVADITFRRKLSMNFYPAPLTLKVLKKNKKLIGFITYTITREKRGHIELIAITADQQRHGYGTLLINSALNDLKKQHIKTVDINVSKQNEKAQKLYNKIGFKLLEYLFEGRVLHFRKEL